MEGNKGGGGAVRKQSGVPTFAARPRPAFSPVSGLEGQVHPLLLARLEADAGFGVELLHGRQDGVPLAVVCSGGSGRWVTERADGNTLPLKAPPTVFLADDVGDPHFPVRGLGPQAVEGVVQAFHGGPGFGSVQISFQEELSRP